MLIDLNREQAIAQTYPPSIIKQLQHVEMSNITVPVIYNICNKYGKYQARIYGSLLIIFQKGRNMLLERLVYVQHFLAC